MGRARAPLGFVANRLMQYEAGVACGAEPHERSDGRTNHRNGYRDRRWETRAGTVDLKVLLADMGN